MRRQNSGDISSFDLLLDTMCNTFGGIVFIALLLSILVGSTTRNAAKPVQLEGPSLSEVEALAEETRLLGESTQIEKTIQALESSHAPKTSQTIDSAQSLAELQATNVTLAAEQNKLTERQQFLEREISRLDESAKIAAVSARDLKEQIQRLKEDLRQKRANATEKVRLPRVRQRPGMLSCFVAIAGGRFYCVSDVSTPFAYRQRKYDIQDVDVEYGEGQAVVEVGRNTGQVIRPGCENQGKIAMALKNCDSNVEIMDFSVRRDSFAEFNYLKQVFVARGFSYNWDPIDGAITIVVSRESPSAQ